MSIRSGIAKATAGALTWGLKNVAHRPAGNFPGKIACYIDPTIIGKLRHKLKEGSIVVVGTNGKTTITNLLADSIEAAGKTVLCNRTGANLDSGIASTLLQGAPSDWGVMECDELWMTVVMPHLQPTHVLLLNLFRDQLDRCGEIDRIQDAIVSSIKGSPNTKLIYNADDPLCEFIARRVKDTNPIVSFGVTENMGLVQNKVSDATMCQNCSHMFEYEYRQYGQLGAYHCANCGFARPELDYYANNVNFTHSGLTMTINNNIKNSTYELQSDLMGSYMAYNLLAVYSTANYIGIPGNDIQRAIDCFNPDNGRLQHYFLNGRKVLLNLAKNPTGFNQNLRIVSADKEAKGIAFLINDELVDGQDISWIWDIDFEELYPQGDTCVFAGGKRRNDLQVRLKYAGIKADLIKGIGEAFEKMDEASSEGKLPKDAPLYVLANYSALPPVKHALDAMAKADDAVVSDPEHKDVIEKQSDKKEESDQVTPECTEAEAFSSPIVIAHILPDLLNLYGDGGSVNILEKRLKWRGIPVEVRKIEYGEPIKFDDVDLVFLGGGPDREQKLATEELFKVKAEFEKYIAEDGPLLAICGGYQILGRTWLLGDEEVAGLGVLGMETRRPGTSANRLVNNIALKSEIAELPVIGYENHAGRTYLDAGVAPFGKVISHKGSGNTDGVRGSAKADGVLSGNMIGTYLHGTLLSKNPEVADWILGKAVERHAARTGDPECELKPLDDSEEVAANEFMAKKLT